MVAYGAVLDALGDPTRRAILERLRQGPRPVGEIADGLPVSRPAVSQHLRVLKEAGLVVDRREGTRRLYAVDPGGLAVLRAYLESLWQESLARFAAHIDETETTDTEGTT
ncbi:MAG TPA: metalloregulator ArsR/SmtB family transcription factor [Acidimicrobiales bacterium]